VGLKKPQIASGLLGEPEVFAGEELVCVRLWWGGWRASPARSWSKTALGQLPFCRCAPFGQRAARERQSSLIIGYIPSLFSIITINKACRLVEHNGDTAGVLLE